MFMPKSLFSSIAHISLVVLLGTGISSTFSIHAQTQNSTPSLEEQTSLEIKNRAGAEYVPGEVIISKKNSTRKTDTKERTPLQADGEELDILEEDAYIVRAKSPTLEKQLRETFNLDKNSKKLSKEHIDTQTQKLIDTLKKQGLAAEPNYYKTLLYSPNDTLFPRQEYLQNTGQYTGAVPGADIKATAAWEITRGSKDIKIGVIDSGIDFTHPDLKNAIAGYDFQNNDNDASDDVGHGSIVAGVAAGTGNNQEGISGVCPKCSILPVKVNNNTEFTTSNSIKGVRYAVDNGAKVLNLSYSGPFSQAEKDAIDYALSKNVTIVAAVSQGNIGLKDYVTYPAYYDGVIAVGSVTNQDKKTPSSDYGSRLDVFAQGNRTLSTVRSSLPSGQRCAENLNALYSYCNGTSYATPQVAGAAGLLLSKNPNLKPAEVRTLLRQGADNIDGLNPNYAGFMGAGRLNVYKSLLKVTQPASSILHVSQCVSGPSVLTRIKADNNSSYVNTCEAGRTDVENTTLNLNENRFLSVAFCVANTDGSNIITRLQASNNPTLPNPCAADSSRTAAEPYVFDMYQNRYLHLSNCQAITQWYNIIPRVFADNDPNPRNMCTGDSSRQQIESPVVLDVGRSNFAELYRTNSILHVSQCVSGPSLLTRLNADQNPNYTTTCESGRTDVENNTFDLYNNRYLATAICISNTNGDDLVTRFNVSNDPNMPQPCAGDSGRFAAEPQLIDTYTTRYLHLSYCQSKTTWYNIIPRVVADNDPNPRDLCANDASRQQVEAPKVFDIGRF
jgi:subtilisin family serine protease